MEELKFPEGKIPQDKPRVLSMNDYLEFVLFCRKNFPHPVSDDDTPAPVRFVIREEDEKYFSRKKS